MEYPFGQYPNKGRRIVKIRLNPSFSGISFRTKLVHDAEQKTGCLNPSFSGISFRTDLDVINTLKEFVLILLLVEYPFGPFFAKLLNKEVYVLILLLVEYPFGHNIVP